MRGVHLTFAPCLRQGHIFIWSPTFEVSHPYGMFGRASGVGGGFMKVVAVLVIRGFVGAKSRLAPVLDATERAALARAMFEDVFAAVRGSKVDEIVVVSPDEEALHAARRKGATCVPEATPQGMNAAFQRSLEYCVGIGADVLVCVPCDIPLLEARDLREVIHRAASGPRVVLSPSTGSAGTSLLVLNPPDAIPFHFEEDSHLLHVQEAERRKIPVAIYDAPSVSLDVDELEDLTMLLAEGKNEKTTAFLEESGIAERLARLEG